MEIILIRDFCFPKKNAFLLQLVILNILLSKNIYAFSRPFRYILKFSDVTFNQVLKRNFQPGNGKLSWINCELAIFGRKVFLRSIFDHALMNRPIDWLITVHISESTFVSFFGWIFFANSKYMRNENT